MFAVPRSTELRDIYNAVRTGCKVEMNENPACPRKDHMQISVIYHYVRFIPLQPRDS